MKEVLEFAIVQEPSVTLLQEVVVRIELSVRCGNLVVVKGGRQKAICDVPMADIGHIGPTG